MHSFITSMIKNKILQMYTNKTYSMLNILDTKKSIKIKLKTLLTLYRH